jgi:CBS domain-containing protein/beta-phosphoglucomutase-like phosphatase (HAD superfamily)
MTLEAIIIRADGAFADTEELRRQAFIKSFAEAGFTWDVDKAEFAKSRALGGLQPRMMFFVRQYLKRRPEAPDVDHLVAAMHRRAGKLFCELLDAGAAVPRPGIRELIVAARREGVRLAIAATLRRVEVECLLTQVLGAVGKDAFASITTLDDTNAAVSPADLYRQVVNEIAVDTGRCLVIEASLSSAAAAKALGLPVLVTRIVHCAESPGAGDSAGVYEDLSGLMGRVGKKNFESSSADERADVLVALQRFHASQLGGEDYLNGSDAMRVSDILKLKGTAVKTIEPTASMRALAQVLRVEAVGAMVVTDAQGAVQGIISERDLSRGLAEFGTDLSAMPVSALMTKSVITCAPEDSVAAVSQVMTQRRIRHLPVVVGGKLAGVISIGDVLKYRLDEVQLEANVLRDYAMSRK